MKLLEILAAASRKTLCLRCCFVGGIAHLAQDERSQAIRLNPNFGAMGIDHESMNVSLET